MLPPGRPRAKPPWLRLVALTAAGLQLAACAATTPRPVARSRPRHHVLPDASTAAESHSPLEIPSGVLVDHGFGHRHEVALTFDSNLTDSMIRELDEHKVGSFDNVAVIDELDRLAVPATFFLAGKWIERYHDTAQRIADDPLFEIGSHSYEHKAFHLPCFGLGGLAPAHMLSDIRRSEELLRELTPRPTRYFRFPGLCHDGRALSAAAAAGVVVIGGDVASGDAFGTSVTSIVSHTLDSVRDGSIVVMHVTGGNTAPLTARALPDVVAGLRARGYRLVTVSDLLKPGPIVEA